MSCLSSTTTKTEMALASLQMIVLNCYYITLSRLLKLRAPPSLLFATAREPSGMANTPFIPLTTWKFVE